MTSFPYRCILKLVFLQVYFVSPWQKIMFICIYVYLLCVFTGYSVHYFVERFWNLFIWKASLLCWFNFHVIRSWSRDPYDIEDIHKYWYCSLKMYFYQFFRQLLWRDKKKFSCIRGYNYIHLNLKCTNQK